MWARLTVLYDSCPYKQEKFEQEALTEGKCCENTGVLLSQVKEVREIRERGLAVPPLVPAEECGLPAP